MVVFNYTHIKRREKRLYSVFNTNISKTGIVTNMLLTMVVLVAIFSIPGLIFCKITGKLWYNPLLFTENGAVGYFYLFFVGLPIAISIALFNVKIQSYRLLDYLKIYFSPKVPLNQFGKPIKTESYKMDIFIRKGLD